MSSHTKLGYASRLLPSPSILHASLGWAETVVGGSQALVHEELGAADAEVPTMAPGGRFAASVHDKQLGQGPGRARHRLQTASRRPGRPEDALAFEPPAVRSC